MDLNNARIKINDIDKEIVILLEKRFDIVMEIGKYKKENCISVYDKGREETVVQNCVVNLKNQNYAQCIKNIYKQIMNTCKKLEN
mgnify:CR=1 FL=1